MVLKVRKDKKFGVKVWVKQQDKDLFRRHCFEYHLSMMFVGEKYLIASLQEMSDAELQKIIETNLETFQRMKSTRDNYETIGIHLTNKWWQKLAYFAVIYKTTVAKVASCIFNHSLQTYELNFVGEQYGLIFNENRRKRIKEMHREDLNERTSDW